MTLPAPLPGAIVHFSFLWADEAAQGLVEGRKDRPCVILAVLGQDQVARRVVLAPITHRAPHEPEAAIALPASLKPVLGLDDAPAWIVAAEINVSDWPGFDLRTVPGKPGYKQDAESAGGDGQHVRRGAGAGEARGSRA